MSKAPTSKAPASAIDPYLLAEALIGRKIDRNPLTSESTNADIQSEYDDLVDVKQDFVLSVKGLELHVLGQLLFKHKLVRVENSRAEIYVRKLGGGAEIQIPTVDQAVDVLPLAKLVKTQVTHLLELAFRRKCFACPSQRLAKSYLGRCV